MKFGRSNVAINPGLSHQVVTLAFLSEQIPAALVTHQLARFLHRETALSVVLVRFAPYDDLTSPGGEPRVYLNGEFRMPNRIGEVDPDFDLLTVGVKGEPSAA